MTQKEQIKALEDRVAMLEARISMLEARPIPAPSWPQWPSWPPPTVMAFPNTAAGIYS